MASPLDMAIIIELIDRATGGISKIQNALGRLAEAGEVTRRGAEAVVEPLMRMVEGAGATQVAMDSLKTTVDLVGGSMARMEEIEGVLNKTTDQYPISEAKAASALDQAIALTGSVTQGEKLYAAALEYSVGAHEDALASVKALGAFRASDHNTNIKEIEDLAALAHDRFKLGVGDLQMITRTVGAAGAAYGITSKQVLELMGVFAQQGDIGNRRALQMASSIVRSISVLDRMNVPIYRNASGAVDIITTMQRLAATLKDQFGTLENMRRELPPEMFARYRAALPSGALEALFRTSPEQFAKSMDAFGKSTGQAGRDAATAFAEFGTELTLLDNAWEKLRDAVGHAIGIALVPALELARSIISPIADWAKAHEDLIGPLGKTVILVGTLVGTLASLWVAFGLIGRGLGMFTGLWRMLRGEVEKEKAAEIAKHTVLGEGTKKVGEAIGGWSRFRGVLGGLASFLFTNPWGLTILGIAGAAVIAYEAWKHWDTIKPMLSSLWGTLKTGAFDVWNWFKSGGWQDVAFFIAGPFGMAVSMIARHWQVIKQDALDAAGWLKRHFEAHSPPAEGPLHDVDFGNLTKFWAESMNLSPIFQKADALSGGLAKRMAAAALLGPMIIPRLLMGGMASPTPVVGRGGPMVAISSSPTFNFSGPADPKAVQMMVLHALERRDSELVRIIEAEVRRQVRSKYY